MQNAQDELENVTYDELRVGQSASVTRTLYEKDIELFAILSGDVNPAHLDADFAKDSMFGGVIGHGMWSGALVSALLGTALPGPGTIYLNQNLDFSKPVRPGETVTVTVTVKEKRDHKRVVLFDCLCTNALGETVASGTAVVIAPDRKIRVARPDLPDIALRRHDHYHALLASCAPYPPNRTAIVHPVSAVALEAAVQAAEAGLIQPVLVGPQARIHQAAETAKLDIGAFELVDAPHSHAAAALAAQMAAAGEAAAVMKGDLSTDELLSALLPGAVGLRTERRVSHAYVMDVPTYHKPLIITDAAINIAPNLDEKADICRNAVDLWRVVTHGAALPKVAILAASEKVKMGIQASVDAACLCKMADRGQIRNALLDGPLALDLAISQESVRNKGMSSAVAGDADILLAPDIHSANMIAKQLTFLGGANAAGIVLGLRVPVILTSRADSVRARLMSCALGVLLAEARREGIIK